MTETTHVIFDLVRIHSVLTLDDQFTLYALTINLNPSNEHREQNRNHFEVFFISVSSHKKIVLILNREMSCVDTRVRHEYDDDGFPMYCAAKSTIYYFFVTIRAIELFFVSFSNLQI